LTSASAQAAVAADLNLQSHLAVAVEAVAVMETILRAMGNGFVDIEWDCISRSARS
jgi:hypothetical protein